MKFSILKKNCSLILVALLVFALALSFGLTMSDGVALADEAPQASVMNSISVGHISDIHYFPIARCYSRLDDGYTADKYIASDFYFSMTGDMKLVEESAGVFDAVCEEIYAAAKAGDAPVYFVASGDLCKNGEHDALVDVANRLRLLQNDVRSLGGKYAQFQIFVVPGNHDLYNGSGAYYTSEDGSTYGCDTVTSAEFALIFNSLGYPDQDLSAGFAGLPASYFATGYGFEGSNADKAQKMGFTSSGKGSGSEYFYGQYVPSSTASDVDITYYNEDLNETNLSAIDYTAIDGADLNVLSYAATFGSDTSPFMLFGVDASYRLEESDVSFAPVLGGVSQIVSGKNYYSFDAESGFTSISQTAATQLVNNGGIAYYDTGLNHSTGGRITEECLSWMQNKIDDFSSNRASLIGSEELAEMTIMATFHQNLNEHWEEEAEILKDFTLYNYRYVANRFLDMGIRYVYTGHMHASDISYYTNAAGQTIYDLETGSLASYDAPVRFTTITRSNANGALAETFESNVQVLKSFNYDKNGDGTLSADEIGINYNEYSNNTIYKVLLERLVSHFICDKTVDGLVGGLPATVGGLVSSILPDYTGIIEKLVATLLDQVLNDLDYTYNGVKYDNAIDWVGVIVDGVCEWTFGNDTDGYMNVKQIVGFVAQAHNAGLEITTATLEGGQDYAFSATAAEYVKDSPTDPAYRAKYVAAIRDLHAQCKSGVFVEKLLNALLDPILNNDNSLLKQLLSYDFKMSKAGFDEDESALFDEMMSTVEGLLSVLGFKGELNITADGVLNLGAILNDPEVFSFISDFVGSSLGFAMSGDSVLGFINTFLDSYLVDSFYVGIGGIVDSIAMAFATDDMADYADPSNAELNYTLRSASGLFEYAGQSKYTYLSNKKSTVQATQNNAMLPSSIVANFDTVDGQNTYTFSYFTEETMYSAFNLYTADGTLIASVDTNRYWLNTADQVNTDANGWYYYSNSSTANGITVDMTSTTMPEYVPLIDLGLLCFTHTAIYKDKDAEKTNTYCTEADRDDVQENSVVFYNRHIVTISGLAAGTTYKYAVTGTYTDKNDNVTSYYLGGNDARYNLATAAGSDVDEFSFLAIADIQGMTEGMYQSSAPALQAIVDGNVDYDFVINAGDMCDNGKNFSQFQWALNTNVDFFANTSTFMTAGNHENGTYALARIFNYTQPAGYNNQTGKTGVYYSFNYGTAHFVVLDTNDASDKGLGTAQLEWLKADLAAAKADANNKYTFVLMHKSLYSGGSHSTDAEVVAMRTQLAPVFVEGNVSIVFGGHDHTYTITNRLDSEGKETNDLSGILYVTLGTIGTKYYTYAENENVTPHFDGDDSVLCTLDTQTFAQIKVSGDLVTFGGYKFNATDRTFTRISDVGVVNADIVADINAKVEAANGAFGKAVQTSWFARNTKGAYNMVAPDGYSVKFSTDGTNFVDNFDDVKAIGGQSVSVGVYLVNANGEYAKIDTVALSVENYVLGIVLWCVIPALAIAGAVTAIILVLRKKKLAGKKVD